MSEKIIVHCPFCDKEHSVRMVEKKYKAYRGDRTIIYYGEAYYCKKKKRTFSDIKLFFKNARKQREREKEYEELFWKDKDIH